MQQAHMYRKLSGPFFDKISQKMENAQTKASKTGLGEREARPPVCWWGLFLPVFHLFANFVKKMVLIVSYTHMCRGQQELRKQTCDDELRAPSLLACRRMLSSHPETRPRLGADFVHFWICFAVFLGNSQGFRSKNAKQVQVWTCFTP